MMVIDFEAGTQESRVQLNWDFLQDEVPVYVLIAHKTADLYEPLTAFEALKTTSDKPWTLDDQQLANAGNVPLPPPPEGTGQILDNSNTSPQPSPPGSPTSSRKADTTTESNAPGAPKPTGQNFDSTSAPPPPPGPPPPPPPPSLGNGAPTSLSGALGSIKSKPNEAEQRSQMLNQIVNKNGPGLKKTGQSLIQQKENEIAQQRDTVTRLQNETRSFIKQKNDDINTNVKALRSLLATQGIDLSEVPSLDNNGGIPNEVIQKILVTAQKQRHILEAQHAPQAEIDVLKLPELTVLRDQAAIQSKQKELQDASGQVSVLEGQLKELQREKPQTPTGQEGEKSLTNILKKRLSAIQGSDSESDEEEDSNPDWD
jgi:hypothetical protein